uniref:hypothetical protein n=1 Tax=Micromonospora acroterricola TaxID=2202421 RepID=UPI00191C0897|nr:hypothetical protein [Micromonospora acroterricola]
MSWLPDDYVHPVYVPVPDTALHLRPIREADTALDHPAVMGSRERLWQIFGPAWAWPRETMTVEEDRIDLLRHEKEIAAHQSFNYALLDEDETMILGASTSTRPSAPAPTEKSPGGSSTTSSAARWSARSTRWSRSGSPPTGPSRGPVVWAATSPGRTGSRCRAPPDTSKGCLELMPMAT